MSQFDSGVVITGEFTQCPVVVGVVCELNRQIANHPSIDIEPNELDDLLVSSGDISNEAIELRVLYCMQGINWHLQNLLPVSCSKTIIEVLTSETMRQYDWHLETVEADLTLLSIERSIGSVHHAAIDTVSAAIYGAFLAIAGKAAVQARTWCDSHQNKPAKLVGEYFILAKILTTKFAVASSLRDLTNITASNWIDRWNIKI